ncbi:MAG: adenylate cyclase, partial [Chitinophagia bacterium]|nr:adenylate cyclase [Chitinophagia bacterium]
MVLNVEIKARCGDPSGIRKFLLNQGADFIGTDHQRDTYFHVPTGRLKLRRGNIENALIR